MWTLQSLVLLIVLTHQAVQADVINFDSLNDGEVVTNQFAGLTFQNTIALASGISLNEFEFPPFSGINVISDNGGPITITFSSSILSFSGYFTYLTRLTMTAYDSSSAQVGMVLSAFGSNLALSGDSGSSPNELLTLNYAPGITRITISGDSAGGSFVMDDATFQGATTVPEPTSLTLVASSILALGLKYLRRHYE